QCRVSITAVRKYLLALVEEEHRVEELRLAEYRLDGYRYRRALLDEPRRIDREEPLVRRMCDRMREHGLARTGWPCEEQRQSTPIAHDIVEAPCTPSLENALVVANERMDEFFRLFRQD